MARPLRIEYQGAVYHVTTRGDGRGLIFRDDDDRRAFVGVLADVRGRFNWVVHAYCLMGNHYHLLVETPEGNLSLGMRHLNGVYTQDFNRRHRRVGHVFQGRYKAILVQKEAYLLELSRYVVLNPVRARMVRSAKDWPWSSYRAMAGLAAEPPWLERDWVLSAFSRDRHQAEMQYRAFVQEGKGQPSPWDSLRNQIYLGSEDFVENMQNRVEREGDLSEVPSAQRRKPPKSLGHYEKTCQSRDEAIATAYASGGYSMKEIGHHFGLHYSRVSRIISKYRKAKGKT